ncbi:MAG: 2,3-bisphosphoglycerate-independent phosphoglycerate mutase [Coriobacteriia bacterium]|nr:2,3-bisphosphoglycerate-independent phosphoglycerate mutase [Coriobacteriia bacterium]
MPTLPSKTPALLVILDGVGIAPPSPSNAVTQADAPFLHGLFSGTQWPYRELAASGRAVGLPVGQMGNSEVGHLNIGAGRVVNQDLTRIDLAIESGGLVSNPDLRKAMLENKANDKRLHFIGLLSDGGVHSMNTHLEALLTMAAEIGNTKISLHIMLDGRDVLPDSGIDYVRGLESFLIRLKTDYPKTDVQIASVGGRFYGMDRDNRWERIELAYDSMARPSAGNVRIDSEALASELVRQSYEDDVFDEFMVPVARDTHGIADGESVVFFNFRPDRARELTQAFIDPRFEQFSRPMLKDIQFVCMTEYDTGFAAYGAHVAFPKETIDNVLADYFSTLGLRQLHIAETEKYAHVTFFFNGGIEEAKPGEERILVPSPKVATYDQKPEMSVYEVTEALVEAIESEAADVYIVNFANGDMVGHTGIQAAAEAAIVAVDRCLEQLIDAILAKAGVAIVTADHGNAEEMLDEQGHVWTAHSTSPVPFVAIGDKTIGIDQRDGACLADIAPSLLDLMGLPVPDEFTGRSLVLR